MTTKTDLFGVDTGINFYSEEVIPNRSHVNLWKVETACCNFMTQETIGFVRGEG